MAKDNRRKSARAPLFMMVETDDGSQPMWAKNVSMGGMRCMSRRPRFPGTMVGMRFMLPGSDENMMLGGQVTEMFEHRDGQFELGVRFCRPADGDRMAIYQFMNGRRELWAA